jgi:hypothetical protein
VADTVAVWPTDKVVEEAPTARLVTVIGATTGVVGVEEGAVGLPPPPQAIAPMTADSVTRRRPVTPFASHQLFFRNDNADADDKPLNRRVYRRPTVTSMK